MADQPISALTAVVTPAEADPFVCVNAGSTKKELRSALRTSLLSPASGNVVVDPAAGNLLVGTTTDAGVKLKTSGAGTAIAGITQNVIFQSTQALTSGVGAAIGLYGNYQTGSNYTTFAVIKATKENATSGEYGSHLDFYSRAHGGNPKLRLRVGANGNIKIQDGVSSAGSYLLHVAGSTDTTLLCVDGATTSTISSGIAPSASYGLWIYNKGSVASIYGAAFATGAHGIYATSISGNAIQARQVGALAATTTDAACAVKRDLTLGGYDATGAVLRIDDSTASTGNLLTVVKQGTTVASIASLGQLALTGLTGGTLPRLKLTQTASTIDAVGFINFDGTSAADLTKNITTLTTSGTPSGHVKVQIAGAARWIPFFTTPS